MQDISSTFKFNDNLNYIPINTTITTTTTSTDLLSTVNDSGNHSSTSINTNNSNTTTTQKQPHTTSIKKKKRKNKKNKKLVLGTGIDTTTNNNNENNKNKNNGVEKIKKTKIKNNKNEKKRINDKSRIDFNLVVYNANYKLFSPFQKYLVLRQIPSLDDLSTEFYHILLDENCQELLKDVTVVGNKIRQQQSEVSKLRHKKKSTKEQEMIHQKKFKPFQIQSHYHFLSDIEKKFDIGSSRDKIEKVVRKVCGFLDKESNMVLVEMILLSIGIGPTLQFLKSSLEIQNKGGVSITRDNIKRNKTTGGIFFKLVSIHLPNDQVRESIFSKISITNYIKQRKQLILVQVPKINITIINSNTTNLFNIMSNDDTSTFESQLSLQCISLFENNQSALHKDDQFDLDFELLNLND